ncbi:glycosyltransferase involved in cell wall biosynthesis [Flavobacterium sp. 9]|uniref:glycosyltransferase n=1 Tax=Flavobacterium sp. 9 TaxID=2035198 RepID=UPI000C1A1734|nr:glycosyltransferase [Flavobacterium sp. 9]PIF31354.1 glycosyltransferase involved in cell wall biosynthesis [Flavobacterium sp. 9]
MKFAIITHVIHNKVENQYFGYAPYIREMNIWLKYVDEVIIVAPSSKGSPTEIDLDYEHHKIDFRDVSEFSFTSLKNNLISLYKLPRIFWTVFWAMKKADHIHLRCPGNTGLIGCFVQILFPKKTKTAKYAGNWDPASKQPWTYKLQKYILGNTFLTKNMQVLVYGDWENQSKNIKPFFTATYADIEKTSIQKLNFDSTIEFIFVGSLVVGKNPMYALKLLKQLVKKGNKAILNFYGEGIERASLENYIKENDLQDNVFLNGNQNKETVKLAYQRSHFVILPSKSEGWPKAVAEGMFYGCVPIATSVSCVPFMLENGNRGILLEMDLENDLAQIENIIRNEDKFFSKSKLSEKWSQNYTVEIFEEEIKMLLVK